MNAPGYADREFDNVSCLPSCVVTGGTAITVANGATHAGVNFALARLTAVTDFNGDGHPDLIWQNDTTRQAATWYLGGALGNQFVGGATLGPAVPGWTVVGSGDFNGDGHSDLVWLNDRTRQLGVWYMGGAQGDVFISSGFLGAGATGVPGWTVRGIADFNRDGHPDVLWQNDVTRQLAIWYMGGAGGAAFLGGNFVAGPVPGWTVVGIGDFNRDGTPDILWQNDATRQVAIWYMGGAQGELVQITNYLGAAGAAGVPGWTVAGVSDFNGDGIPDVVWQSDLLRQVGIWYMSGPQGAVVASSVFVGGAGATGVPGWRVVVR